MKMNIQFFATKDVKLKDGDIQLFPQTKASLLVNDDGTPYTPTLPQATTSTLGGVKAKPSTTEDTQEVHINSSGELVTKAGGGSLPIASSTKLGGIKVGSDFTIASDGILSLKGELGKGTALFQHQVTYSKDQTSISVISPNYSKWANINDIATSVIISLTFIEFHNSTMGYIVGFTFDFETGSARFLYYDYASGTTIKTYEVTFADSFTDNVVPIVNNL